MPIFARRCARSPRSGVGSLTMPKPAAQTLSVRCVCYIIPEKSLMSLAAKRIKRGVSFSEISRQEIREMMDRLIGNARAAAVAVSMGIGAALLGYPAWAIPLIALLGAGGAVVAVRLIG